MARMDTLMTTATLDMLTLNTWGFAWPLARHRKPRFERIASHLREGDYDVVLLQELWRGAREALGDSGMSFVGEDAQSEPGVRPVESGLGVKVRRGLVRSVATVKDLVRAFKHHRGWDRVKTKGIVGVEVETAACGPVTFINTHLQAQERHANVLRDAVDGVRTPIVLSGDFNLFESVAEDRAAHQSLERHGFRDASLVVDRPDATYLGKNPYVGGHSDQRFDRIYLRDGWDGERRVRIDAESVRVIVDHARPLSDHEAVAARLRLRKEP
jgi:endonuclease/exonuclease/phosphatase family metal-dependent hydrolase